jgi:hypothetical protein
MLAKLLLSILLAALFVESSGQTTILGKWRRLNPTIKHQDITNKQSKFGDLEISTDSTFHIEGDSSSKNSTISGWHVGDEYNGTWGLHNSNRLTLWFEPKDDKMFLSYLIIKQTKQKLVLRSASNIKDRKRDIVYLRL